MERKIGEIFEYKGEWYQCIKDDYLQECTSCAFYNKGYFSCEEGSPECVSHKRNDNTNVIFKKLEKVGGPYRYMGKVVQKYKTCCDPVIAYSGIVEKCTLETVDIVIKQNQEDMEEKKLSLRPFDLEAAKAGKPVCTRDGRKARIICFDKGKQANDFFPIIALVETEESGELIINYTNTGHYWSDTRISDNDLVMLLEKKEMWTNVYRERCYETKAEAMQSKLHSLTCVDTIRIEIEE